ncbi:Ig-like domain-containing protein [Butyrivibrio sp. DSM 10294]|uniref:Ig-like domain-containing protein n=1 Tax=Butyrivibrio sp. DSM 10294 TaxID=2972457 RepID=UPI00234E49E2|nr:Ig-like domain-containing protein [Butyrivibrio sp. DSM 10294]MDC7292473.1 Ig-like domain-containing protein [Butyrivibrio sp. DSM 10294]
MATAFLTQSVGAAAAGECTGYDLTDSQDYWEIEDISEDASEEASDGTQENISVAEDDEIIIDETNEPDSEELGSENYAVDSSYENNDEQICEDEEWNDPESEEYVIGDDEVYDEQEELTYEETEDISGNDLTQEDISANDSAEDISGNDVTGDSCEWDEKNAQAGTEKKITAIEIFSEYGKSSEKSKLYGIKYGKNEVIKSGIFTFGTEYTAMKLTTKQKTKDGSEIKTTPVWKSSNEKVVKVTSDGLHATIKAVGIGKATITCTAGDGSKKSAKVSIQVIKNAVNTMAIFSGVDKTSEKSGGYGIKYSKNGAMTKGIFTLDTDYTSMKLTVSQKGKTGNEIKAVPDWKSSNDNVVKVTPNGLSATIKAVGLGKATITCFAGDDSKKKTKVVINVKQGVTKLEITGQTYIAAGKNASYKTIAYPKKASNKKVTWSLKKDIPGVSVNPSSGKVSVTKDVAKGTKVVIIATAKDCSGVYTEKEITVRERATKVTLSTPSTTTIATHAVGDLKDSVSFEASTDNDETVSWKVSNDKIANLSIKGNKATLTALAAGNVTVTAFANDGSGKKATAKIKMVIPVSDLSLSVPIDRQDDKLASGGSLQFTPVIGTKYGKPSNSKIRWEYEIVGYKDKGQTSVGVISDATMAKILKKKYLFTFSNGKITAVSQKKYDKQAVDLRFDCECNNYGIKVTAYTTDGSNLHSETKLVKRVDCNTYMKLSRGNTYEVLVGKDYPYTCMLLSENRQNKLYIVNKNEDIATLTVNEKDYVHIHGKKKGTTTVTIKAMDGSGLSVKVTIKVI